MIFNCPGQDKRNLKVEMINCQNCGYEIEFFSDEITRICPQCKAVAYRERMPSCIDWCKSAKECMGEKIYNKYSRDRKISVKKG